MSDKLAIDQAALAAADTLRSHPCLSLPAPDVARAKVHNRSITCEGFLRDDGLVDMEAWMSDAKSYALDNRDRGGVDAGEPIHSMGLRVTIDPMTAEIKDVVAVMADTPYGYCPGAANAYKKLIGLKLGPGFNQKARELAGGIAGCTHIGHLLSMLATVYFQTTGGGKFRQLLAGNQDKSDFFSPDTDDAPYILNTCRTWASDSPVVAREMRMHYTGDDMAGD